MNIELSWFLLALLAVFIGMAAVVFVALQKPRAKPVIIAGAVATVAVLLIQSPIMRHIAQVVLAQPDDWGFGYAARKSMVQAMALTRMASSLLPLVLSLSLFKLLDPAKKGIQRIGKGTVIACILCVGLIGIPISQYIPIFGTTPNDRPWSPERTALILSHVIAFGVLGGALGVLLFWLTKKATTA